MKIFCMISQVFPYIIQLNILQLEEYSLKRFLCWIANNFTKRSLEGKKKLVWTAKAKLLTAAVIIELLAAMAIMAVKFGLFGLILTLILATQPYLFLTVGLLALFPLDKLTRTVIRIKTKIKIKRLKAGGLKVIGITGSYGKTGTKEILYQLLKTKYRVLKTPLSYNTLLGIAKVVDWELDKNYDFFICEMGAYKKGEIRGLCWMVQPDHAILTGINQQHIERFGSEEAIIQTKFELVDYVEKNSQKDSQAVMNQDSRQIMENYKYHAANPVFYGTDNGSYRVKSHFNPERLETEFQLNLNSTEFKGKTKLIGKPAINNLLAAGTMASLLAVDGENIVKTAFHLKNPPHRLEIKQKSDGNIIIDDSYNSNRDGFMEALGLLNKFEDRKKIIVTPGIVELGNTTKSAHEQLGKQMDRICDYVILVGKNERTLALKENVNIEKVVFIERIQDFTEILKQKEVNQAAVLLENDLPDNY